ncbi:hypothetical protein [uncultured Roseovarius sp.]|uniref:hypothetical protein n=1 Tax=uncultured Roseovarius sp. TaxID=293344 RepID=UPI002596B6E6|nr:hypothetical protein [uncultured Roseovarius sp.]
MGDVWRISDLAKAVTSLEGLKGNAVITREKGLRNLTQKLPFSPASREGRADLYAEDTIAAIRLVQIAGDMGLGRAELADLTFRLTSEEPLAEKVKVEGGWTRPHRIALMVQRAKAGETFNLRIGRTVHGHKIYSYGLSKNSVVEAIYESADAELKPVAVLEIHASQLISDLLGALKG